MPVSSLIGKQMKYDTGLGGYHTNPSGMTMWEASLLLEKADTVNIEFDVLATGAKSGRERPGMNMPGH
jgi:hypothetical protein